MFFSEASPFTYADSIRDKPSFFDEYYIRQAMACSISNIGKGKFYNHDLYDEMISMFDDLKDLTPYQKQILANLNNCGYPYDYFKCDVLKDVSHIDDFYFEALDQIIEKAEIKQFPDKEKFLAFLDSFRKQK